MRLGFTLDGVVGNNIEALQNKRFDGLAKIRTTYLKSLKEEFEKLKIWDKFMIDRFRVSTILNRTPVSSEGQDATLALIPCTICETS